MLLRQLRIMRKQNRLSQQQLADALGISRSTYCSYEIGRRTPDIEMLLNLAEFYKLSLDKMVSPIDAQYLLDEDYYDGQPDDYYLSKLSKDEIDLIVRYRCLNSAKKRHYKNLLKDDLEKDA